MPLLTLDGSDAHCVCAAVVNGYSVSLSTTTLDGVALVCATTVEIATPLIDLSRVMASLNANLHTLRASIDWLLRNVSLADRHAETAIAIMLKSYYNVLRNVNNVLTLQQILDSTLPFEPTLTDVARLLEQLAGTVNLLTSKFNQRVVFRQTGSDGLAFLDETLIERLVLNIIAESLGNMRAGGTVVITLNCAESQLVITIEDDGGGLNADTFSGLFTSPTDPLSLTELSENKGLGLYIARGIVKLHNGRLLMQSKTNDNISVSITLPRGDDSSVRLNTPTEKYRSRGMEPILRELSAVLGHEFYGAQYRD